MILMGMVHACDPSIWEAVTKGSCALGQLGIHSETLSPDHQRRKGSELMEEVRRGQKRRRRKRGRRRKRRKGELSASFIQSIWPCGCGTEVTC